MVGIVLEYAAGGSLSDALKSGGVSKNWTWEDPLLKIASDIAQGMNFLHGATYVDDVSGKTAECVLHLDLKPGNVLLTPTFSAKVSDFGKSKAFTKKGKKMYENESENLNESSSDQLTGTPIYMSPEIVR